MFQEYNERLYLSQNGGERAKKKQTTICLGLGAGVLLLGLILLAALSTRDNSTSWSGALIPRNIYSYFKLKSARRTLRDVASGAGAAGRTESSVPADLHWSSDLTKAGSDDRDITFLLYGSSNRPVEGHSAKVYAWYVERPKNIKERDDELIASWKSVWTAYGYDPYVLGVADAQNNPEFLDFDQSLDAVLNPSYPREAAMRPCYLRYLAMAMQEGGGMMVDLDTTPTNIAATQQNNPHEKFTLYCQVDSPGTQGDWLRQMEHQSGLPCAAAGTASEWMRVAKLAVWTMQYATTFGGNSWTDMYSLGKLSTWNEIDLVKEQRVRSAKAKSWDTCMFRTA